MKKSSFLQYPLFIVIYAFGLLTDVARAADLPEGRVFSLQDAENIVQKIGEFAMWASAIIVTIFIIWAGISYTMAGNDEKRITAAKGKLKSGIIGALIIFGIGVILSTISAGVTNPGAIFNTR